MKDVKIKNKVDKDIDLIFDTLNLIQPVLDTYGPNGKLALINRVGQKPYFTKDGYTVAKAVYSNDEMKDSILQAIKEAAFKTNETAGDGTTTTTILTAAILCGVIQLQAEQPKHSLRDIFWTLNKVALDLINKLKESSVKLEKLEDYINVATISCNNNAGLGELIGKAMYKLGPLGTIVVNHTDNEVSYMQEEDGVHFSDCGYYSPSFVNNSNKGIVDFTNPVFIIKDAIIAEIQDIEEELTYAAKRNKPIVIVANDMKDEALDLVYANLNNGLNICYVQSPSFGEDRSEILNDLRILTEDENGVCSADRVEIGKNYMKIFGQHGNKDYINTRVKELTVRMNNLSDEETMQRGQLAQRISTLTESVIHLFVASNNILEQNEILDRVDDAISAVRSAIKYGYVYGGGYTLANIISDLEADTTDPLYDYILSFFKSPIQALGYSTDTVKKDPIVLDSTYSITESIRNSVSICKLILNTGSIISDNYRSPLTSAII